MKRIYGYDIYKCGPEKLKLSAKCDYNDNKQMGEHSKNIDNTRYLHL